MSGLVYQKSFVQECETAGFMRSPQFREPQPYDDDISTTFLVQCLCVWLRHDLSDYFNSIVDGVVVYFLVYHLCWIKKNGVLFTRIFAELADAPVLRRIVSAKELL